MPQINAPGTLTVMLIIIKYNLFSLLMLKWLEQDQAVTVAKSRLEIQKSTYEAAEFLF